MSMNSERVRWLTACTVVAMSLWIATAETAQTRPMVLDNVCIVDGGGGTPIENGRIVIERDRLARVGPAAAIAAPAGAETVDLSGRTVIPGSVCSSIATAPALSSRCQLPVFWELVTGNWLLE